MRFVALIFGLTAGIFALATPVAFKSDLMTPFIEYWAARTDGRLAVVLTWYALPASALLGGILAVVSPGFAAWLLLGAAAGWFGIGVFLPELMDFKLLVPAGAAGFAGIVAFLAGELDIHRRRRLRRERRATAVVADTGEVERESAFRIDPTLVPRETPAPRESMAPPPRRSVPLKFEDMGDTAHQAAPYGPPPRTGIRQEIQPAPAGGRQTGGFQWDEGDQPGLEPEPEQPRPSPRLEPREAPRAGRVEFVPRPAARRAEVQPELRSEPRAVQQPYRRPIPQRRDDSLVGPIVAGIAAVLIISLLAGVYVAYREGYIDRIVAAIESPSVPTAVADTTTAAPAVPPPAAVATPASSASATTAPALPLVLPELSAGTGVTEASYDDPFAYCAAVGTIDHIDSRYRGPAVTPAMTQALRAPDSAGRDRVHWRCAGGIVMACASYAGPICDAAPSVAEMQSYCERNPEARPLFAPHGIWSCVAGKPQLPPEANWPVDAQGFMPRAWIALRAPTGSNG